MYVGASAPAPRCFKFRRKTVNAPGGDPGGTTTADATVWQNPCAQRRRGRDDTIHDVYGLRVRYVSLFTDSPLPPLTDFTFFRERLCDSEMFTRRLVFWRNFGPRESKLRAWRVGGEINCIYCKRNNKSRALDNILEPGSQYTLLYRVQ